MLKLRYSATSPFVRKCMATAIEAGVADKLELEISDPYDPATDLTNDNPIGKIPALVLSDGSVLFDSPVICEYLDAISRTSHLFPSYGDARWLALTRMALADGLLDAVILRRRECMRPTNEQSSWWLERYFSVIKRAIDAMETKSSLYKGVDIGLLTTAIALEYIDFRFPEYDWRESHSHLALWHSEFTSRSSLRDTAPEG